MSRVFFCFFLDLDLFFFFLSLSHLSLAVQFQKNVAVQVFMGIGMLSMPYAMRLSGWSGIAALAGALALFNASAHLLVGGLEMLPAGVPRSYPSLGAAAFGPAGRRLVGLLALSEFGGGAIVTFVSRGGGERGSIPNSSFSFFFSFYCALTRSFSLFLSESFTLSRPSSSTKSSS